MAGTKATIVCVPGAWQTHCSFDEILPYFHAAGFPTTTINLPSVGVSPGLPDFSADVQAIRDVVGGLIELGRNVVILAHSYGGIPASEAMKDISKETQQPAASRPGRVSRLIYVAALVPASGQTSWEAAGELKTMEKAPGVEIVFNDVRKASKRLQKIFCSDSRHPFSEP
jgi:pimeloyl-ACP methyl ester carboxylesterase